MPSKALKERIKKFNLSDQEIKRNLETALDLVETDPALSIARTRMTLEVIIKNIFKKNGKALPPSADIRSLLKTNFAFKSIEPRIMTRMHTIRSMGNLGIHSENVNNKDALMGLENLCDVMDWYIGKYPQKSESSKGPKKNKKNYLLLLAIPIGLLIAYFIFSKFQSNKIDTASQLIGTYQLQLIDQDGSSIYNFEMRQKENKIEGSGNKTKEKGLLLPNTLQPEIQLKGNIKGNKIKIQLEEWDEQMINDYQFAFSKNDLNLDTIKVSHQIEGVKEILLLKTNQ